MVEGSYDSVRHLFNSSRMVSGTWFRSIMSETPIAKFDRKVLDIFLDVPYDSVNNLFSLSQSVVGFRM